MALSEEEIAEIEKARAEYFAQKHAEKTRREEARKAQMDEYHEQLNRGNSNIGSGAHTRKTRAFPLWSRRP